MKIRVDRVLDNFVYCSSPFGPVKLFWIGDSPIVTNFYYVELDINQTLCWNKDISLSHTDKYVIESTEQSTKLYGLLESVDADGYTVLRIGSSIITFITKGTAFKIGSYICVCTGIMSAYPYDI